MKHVDEIQGALAELLRDLEAVAFECAAARDEMGIYLLDLALEECRDAIWQADRILRDQQSH